MSHNLLNILRVSHIYVEWKLWFTVASEIVLSSTGVGNYFSRRGHMWEDQVPPRAELLDEQKRAQ